MKLTFTRAIALQLTLGLTAASMAVAAPTNKELKIGITQEFENMNPMISQMSATSYINAMTNHGLVTMDGNAEWVPLLVKEIPTLENGKAKFVGEGENRKIFAEWEIRENAVWADGTPITGHDVKFSWETGLIPTIGIASREQFTDIEKIEIDPKNPKKFTFLYSDAEWTFYQLGTFPILPKHIEEAAVTKYAKEAQGYENNTKFTKDPTNPGLYNGPYVVKEVKLGSHVILDRNDKFYGDQAKIERIIVKLIPNTATLEANLRSGTIDMISTLGLTFDQALAFEKTVKKDNLPFNVNFKPSTTYEHIDLQLKDDVLKDVRVRKALVHAIDRQQLVNALFEGKQQAAIHNLATIDPWYIEDPKHVVLYPHSRRTAGKLLDEAGWKMAKDGYRYKDGKKLQFQLMTTADNKVRELVEAYLQEQWKKAGIDITIKNEPARVFFGETVKKSKFPHMAMFAWISAPYSIPKSTLHSDFIPTEANAYSGQNSPSWSNPEVDKLLDALEKEFDPKKQQEIRNQITWHYTNDVPVIPLYYRAMISATPKNLTGYGISGHQFHNSTFANEWSLEPSKVN